MSYSCLLTLPVLSGIPLLQSIPGLFITPQTKFNSEKKTMKIFCRVLCCLVLLIAGSESRARSCPQISQMAGRLENTPCPFFVLSTKAYIYRPSEELICKFIYSFKSLQPIPSGGNNKKIHWCAKLLRVVFSLYLISYMHREAGC